MVGQGPEVGAKFQALSLSAPLFSDSTDGSEGEVLCVRQHPPQLPTVTS